MAVNIKDYLRRLHWRLRSVPIFYKTIGVVGISAFIFGAVTLYTTRHDLTDSLCEVLQERAASQGRALAERLALPMNRQDSGAIQQIIEETMAHFPDIRYIIVRERDGRVVAHRGAPALHDGWEAPWSDEVPERHRSRVLDAGGAGRIFESHHGIGQGEAGFVQIGISDQMMRQQLRALASSMLTSMGISVTIAILLGGVLTFLIVQPIQHLKEALNDVARGNFEARSKIFSSDEIGQMAAAFNETADSLQRYREDVKEKERVRQELIERVVSSHEDERKLISRELHDDLGQSLLAILMDIRSRKGANGEIPHELMGLKTQVEQVIDAVTHIVNGMRPSVLDHYGIHQALESYVQEFSQRYGLEMAYKCTSYEGFDGLPSVVEVSLYRIVQESLSNIIKYAAATHVSILLIISRNATTLLVEDDGKGFELNNVLGQGGVGLVSMHERATLLGGAVDFESKLGQGTTVRVTIPG